MSQYKEKNLNACCLYASKMEQLLSSPPVDRKRELLLSLRLVTLIMVVVLLTMHIRTVRMFKWEQMVSGGILCTYLVVSLGLAMSAGIDFSTKTMEVRNVEMSCNNFGLIVLENFVTSPLLNY